MTAKKIVVMCATTLLKIAVVCAIVLVLYKLSFYAYDFGYKIFAAEAIDSEPGKTMTVAIVEGKSVSEIGAILEEKGLIEDARLFYFQEMFSEYKGKLNPGIYELSTSMTPYAMMQIMATTAEDEESQEESEE